MTFKLLRYGKEPIIRNISELEYVEIDGTTSRSLLIKYKSKSYPVKGYKLITENKDKLIIMIKS